MSKSPVASLDQLEQEEGKRRSFTSQKFDLIDAMLVDVRLRAIDFRVAVALLQFLNGKTGQCNPAHETIATYLNVTVRTVELSLKKIREAGWVRWQRGNRQLSNFYEFDVTNVGQMLDRRTSIADSLKEERVKRRSDAKQISGQESPTRTDLRVSNRNPLRVPTRSQIRSNTVNEPLNGTPEEEEGIERKKTKEAWRNDPAYRGVL